MTLKPPSTLALLATLLLVPGCVGDIGDGPGDGALGEDGGPLCANGALPTRLDARRLTPTEYKNVIRDVFGSTVVPSDKYPGSYGKSSTGFSTEPTLYTVGEQSVESLMIAAEDVAESVAGSLPTLLPCAAEADPGDTCLETYLSTYVERAYRRPITEEERATLVATYDDGRATGASFTEAIAMVTAHALQTPQFVYLTEAAGGEGRELDGYELATRLSFYLWQTIPDEQLLAKAASGELADREARAAEARRLLADPRADATLIRFFREWTVTEDVTPGDKDPNAVAGFDDAQAASMAESFDRFVLDQARNGTIESLLTSRAAWVDANMARFFGQTSQPTEWTQTQLDERYSGLVTQPLFLASHAHYGDANYVARGKFVRVRLLCAELGSPPADAQAQFAAIPKPADPTGKDVSASVTANPSCAGCHHQIDPGGLALENFGALGEYRTTYTSGKAIDPSGTLLAVGDGDLTFASYSDMFAALANDPAVAACFGTQIVRFALSRPETEEDVCAAKEIGEVVASPEGKLADALVAMAVSDAFAIRRD